MKVLLMDVGNSRIKWGVQGADGIRRTGHISQDRIRDKGLQVLTTKIPRGVDDVFVSNVAGTTFATRLSGVVGAHCGCDVRFARSDRRDRPDGISQCSDQDRLRWARSRRTVQQEAERHGQRTGRRRNGRRHE